MYWDILEALSLVGVVLGCFLLWGPFGLICGCVGVLALSLLVNRPWKGGEA